MITDKLGDVKYAGKSSREAGLMLQSTMEWQTPIYSSTLTQISGKSTAVIVSNNRYDNVSQAFPFRTLPGANPLQLMRAHRAVLDWLYSVTPDTYHKIEFTGIPNTYFMGIPTTVTAMTDAGDHATLSVTFSMEPFAYDNDGDVYLPVSEGQNFANSYQIMSVPLIHVTGNGNGSFDLNGKTYSVVGVKDELWLDCEDEVAYDKNNDVVPNAVQFDDYAFPTLQPGDNVFSNIKNIGLEMKPHWRQLF
ncbi:hypothetical protein [Schleiferilactobacillus harbinensis]|uniref:Phage tail protein n=1 Tax=Schleiferilactobacillus harbinensis TaxID=304207 RepID=A0A5P8M557_9LACO|nr:hypothetical protein [Schleiferilactobacillus harbinensis]QFR23231.1 hypothetical protein D1010_07365 [Schleiferilactobacillus harbinensis]